MDDTAHLRYERPAPHRVRWLAPMVQIERDDWDHESHGYALCITSAYEVEVILDDGWRGRLPLEDVLFVEPRTPPAVPPGGRV